MGAFARPFARFLRPFSAALGRYSADAGFTPIPVTINGTFNDATGWGVPASCTIAGGVFSFANTAANVTATYNLAGGLQAGTYRVQFDIVTHVTGNITMRFNAGAFVGTSYVDTETGTFVNDIVCSAAPTVFEIRVTRDGTAMDCSVDNITITRIA